MKDLNIKQKELEEQKAKGVIDYDPEWDPAYEDKQVTESDHGEEEQELDADGNPTQLTRA